MKNSGIFIVLEGSDGSGKTTHFKLLVERLKAVGYEVAIFDFPQYDQESSYFIKQYLKGAYGESDTISPYVASMFYALDRYEAAPKIRQAIKDGKIVVSNRYVASNMAHQGAKFGTDAQKRGFFLWEDTLEFNTMGIPRPTVNIYLRLPAEKSFELIANRNQIAGQQIKKDQHESNLDHLRRASETYDLLSALFPKDFKKIDCVENHELLSVPKISDKIWQLIKPLLPPNPPNPGYDTVVDLEKLTPEIKVPASEQASKIIETSHKKDQIEIKNISLMTADVLKLIPGIKVSTKLKWPSLQADKGYYVFRNLTAKDQTAYKKYNQQLIANHQKISLYFDEHNFDAALKKQVLLNITPLFALTDVSITASQAEIKSVQLELLNRSYDEAKWLAGQLNSAVAEPKLDLKPINDKSGPAKLQNIISDLTASQTDESPSSNRKLELIDYSPKKEFDLIEKSLYLNSASSQNSIQNYLNSISYDEKYKMLLKLLDADAGLINEITYTWNLTTNVSDILSLNRKGLIKNIVGQKPSIYSGYDKPESVRDSEIEEVYDDSFNISKKIYADFKATKDYDILPYLTLAGHKGVWQFSTTASNIRLLATQSQSKKAIQLVRSMKNRINEVHPIISARKLTRKSKRAQAANNAKIKSQNHISIKPPK